jgi:hypothetical protein
MKLFEIETSAAIKFSLEKYENYPETAFIHARSYGFSSCQALTRQQATDLAAALVDFATQDDAEGVTA